MAEEKRQHLEFIQNIITRMNTNSFQLKGIAITIVSALLAIYGGTQNVIFIFLGIPSTLLFWFLDSYYLQQERKFRGVYNNVAGLKKLNAEGVEDIDNKENKIVVKPYAMPINEYTKKINKQYSYFNVFFSKTILWLYLSVILFLVIMGFVLII